MSTLSPDVPVTENIGRPRGKRPRQQQEALPMFDQQMRKAKNDATILTIYLPGPTQFTDDEDNSCAVKVEIVDRFAILFSVVGTNICVWVPKQDVLVQMGSK